MVLGRKPRAHLHQNLKRPHWVPYEAEATQKLERACRTIKPQYSKCVAPYTGNLTAMTQMKNLNGINEGIPRDARGASAVIRACRRRSRCSKS